MRHSLAHEKAALYRIIMFANAHGTECLSWHTGGYGVLPYHIAKTALRLAKGCTPPYRGYHTSFIYIHLSQ